MELEKLRRVIIEAASSELDVYYERSWAEVNGAGINEEFCLAFKGRRRPHRIHAEINYSLDTVGMAAITYGNIYDFDPGDEEPEKVEPFIELEVVIPLPEKIVVNDPLNLMKGVFEVTHLSPNVDDKIRTVSFSTAAVPPGPHSFHHYTVTWFWHIDEDELFDGENYRRFFVKVRKAMEYLLNWIDAKSLDRLLEEP
jgi:hypothetical protein